MSMKKNRFAVQRSFTLFPVDEQALNELAKHYRTNLSAAVRLAIQREYLRLTAQGENEKRRRKNEPKY